MSRLDSVINRLTAQRACLRLAAELIRDVPGPVLEIGLGNGRTYDHLRELLPARAIFAFDRRSNAHPDSTPDAAHLILGEFADTIPGALARIGAPAALAHADFGSGDGPGTAALAAWLGPALAPLLRPGTVVASDQRLDIPGSTPLALPEGVAPARYFLYLC
ncbi:MAG TPA: class I SAM-dependent methyltransferase [Candidatus Cybelea sp.]|nr:class I SAM-dependent methyltransferase [Candidatus Cybelea sp.]